MADTGERFERAVEIMAKLRAPGGCPWDREQTFDSIKPYTIEETYEVVEAIENRDWHELTGELGDLLLQVLFYAQMAAEEQRFTIDDVIERLSSKLVFRHPHVFGNVQADTPDEVLRNWEALKGVERQQRQNETGESQARDEREKSMLAGVSRGLPGLIEASKISSKVARAGFEWPQIEGIFEKLSEETDELREELKQYPGGGPLPPTGRGIAGAGGNSLVPDDLQQRLEGEIGDLLFTVVNLARYLRIDPEAALKRTNRKFRTRFQSMEERAGEQGRKIEELSLEEMETLWQESKQAERGKE